MQWSNAKTATVGIGTGPLALWLQVLFTTVSRIKEVLDYSRQYECCQCDTHVYKQVTQVHNIAQSSVLPRLFPGNSSYMQLNVSFVMTWVSLASPEVVIVQINMSLSESICYLWFEVSNGSELCSLTAVRSGRECKTRTHTSMLASICCQQIPITALQVQLQFICCFYLFIC